MSEFERDIAAVQRIPAVATILDVVRRVTGMRFIAIARVTEDRWIACATKDDMGFGLGPGGELRIETTLCNEIRRSETEVVIDDVESHPVYCNHPTPALYGFRSYISMPIFRPDGQFFGTLCAIDQAPARVSTPEIVGMFRLFADLIGFHVDIKDRLETTEAALASAHEAAKARERFVAVLGHDLRNPLASIKAGIALLARQDLDARSAEVLGHLRKSTERMGELIENMLDLARGRLAGGLPIRRALVSLDTVLHQVVEEVQAAHPHRAFEVTLDIPALIRVDPGRISQLVSNLVSNAVTHGSPDGPVRVHAALAADHVVISVANRGDPIPPSRIDRLFEPFNALESRGPKEGLGLGLYIASEISRAHGGTLTVTSTAEETRFTFTAPVSSEL